MGTRSLTRVMDEENKIIVNMYRQFDGYPSGHGKELAEFMKDRVVGNGIPLNTNRPEKFSNGPNCLAAQMVLHFKMDNPIGGIYLYPTDVRDVWEEYIYNIKAAHDKDVIIECYDPFPNLSSRLLFYGSPVEFSWWVNVAESVLDEDDQIIPYDNREAIHPAYLALKDK